MWICFNRYINYVFIENEINTIFNNLQHQNYISYIEFIQFIKPSKTSDIKRLKQIIHDTLEDSFKKNGNDAYSLFKKFSCDKDFITRKIFVNMIRSFFPEGKDLSNEDILSIMYEIDKDDNQKISYSEFVKYFFPNLDKTNEILKKMRLAISKKAIDHDYREIFEYIDKDNNGKVDVKEFYNGLKRLGVDFTQDECRIIFEEIDKDKNGYV